MNLTDARSLIIKESLEGIAYTSRMGDYSTPENFNNLLEAINTIAASIGGEKMVDRELFCALFVIGNQIEGNACGTISKEIDVPEWLLDHGIVELNEALYAIFEDHEID